MNVRYSPEAREDLRQISRFIALEYQNPKAAAGIIRKIMQNCAALKQFPQMGMRLSEKIQRETSLRFLICGKHIAFYRTENADVCIIRILDGRTNYLRVLFEEDEPV